MGCSGIAHRIVPRDEDERAGFSGLADSARGMLVFAKEKL